MAVGSRYWASSFVITTNGKKYYLSNSFYDLERQMNSKKGTIEVETSNLFSKKYVFLKKSIEVYGKC